MHPTQHTSITADSGTYLKPVLAIAVAFAIMMGTLLLLLQAVENEQTIQRKNRLRQHTEIALGALSPIITGVRRGDMNRDDALATILPQVRRMTYEDELGSNYFFIVSYEGLILAQPFEPHLEMTHGEALANAGGQHVVETLLTASRAQPEGTFVEYDYQNPSTAAIGTKLSYVKAIPELGIAIGTGCHLSGPLPFKTGYVISGAGLTLLAITMPFMFCMRRTKRMLQHLTAAMNELQQKNNDLNEAEIKYRTILDNAIEGIVIMRDFRITLSNHAFCAVTGHPMREVQHSSIARFMHPTDFAQLREQTTRRSRGEMVPTRFTFRLVDKHGNTRWMTGTISAIVWQNKPAQLAIISDNTDLKLAQEALLSEKERLRYIMDNAPFSICVFSKDGYLRYVNRANLSMWGLEHDDMVNKYNLFHDPQFKNEPFRTQALEAFGGKTVTTAACFYDSSAMSPSGHKHNLTLHLYPVFNAKGQVTDVVTIHATPQSSLLRLETDNTAT